MYLLSSLCHFWNKRFDPMVGIQKNVIISQNCHLDGINSISIQIKVIDRKPSC